MKHQKPEKIWANNSCRLADHPQPLGGS